MTAFAEALGRLPHYNFGVYDASTNPYGMSGVGGMDANWEQCNADIATVAQGLATVAGSTIAPLALAWDTGTADADPGSGEVRANHATLASATQLYVSTTDADGADVSAVIGLFDDSTSAIKGVLRIGHRSDAAKWALFTVSGSVVSATGYRKLTVSYVAGSGTLSAADPVALGFVRTGDKGETGATGAAGADGTNKVCEGGTAGGTANAPTVTASPAFTGTRGEMLAFKTGASPNTDAVTITANGVSQTARKNGAAMVAGDLPANTRVALVSDGTYLELVSGGGSGALGALGAGIRSISGSDTVVVGDRSKLLVVTVTATLTLTAAATCGNGWSCTVMAAGSGSVTIDPAGSETVNGLSSVVVAPGGAALLTTDGSAWRAVLIRPADSTTAWAWSSSIKSASLALSNSNRTISSGSGTFNGSALGTAAITGKRIFGMVVDALPGGSDLVIGFGTTSINTGSTHTGTSAGWGYRSNGQRSHNNASSSYGSIFAAGDQIDTIIDQTNGKAWWAKNGVIQGSGDPVAGTGEAYSFTGGQTLYPAVGVVAGGTAIQVTSTPPLVTLSGWSSL